MLGVLTRSRLLELGRELEVALPSSATKEAEVERLLQPAGLSMATLLRGLTRDELKAACYGQGLGDSAGARGELRRRVGQVKVGPSPAPEVQLSRLLAECTRLMRPARDRSKLVFINLQKRLLPSIEAFQRAAPRRGRARPPRSRAARSDPPGAARRRRRRVRFGRRHARGRARLRGHRYFAPLLPRPAGRARALLAEMYSLAARFRGAPDAKTEAILDWIRENQCRAGPRRRRPRESGVHVDWSGRRVLILKEDGDTKR